MNKLLGYLAGALVLALLTTGGCSVARDKPEGFIVTEEQLRSVEGMPEEDEIERGEPPPGSPRILVSVPVLGAEVMAPVPVSIRFVANPDAQIVPESLQVYYGAFDVTKKVRKNLKVSQDGIDGTIKEAYPGKYKFRVSISDTQNRTGEANLRFRVVTGR